MNAIFLRCTYAVLTAALVVATPAAADARADNPPVTDDVLDAVDSVIAEPNPAPAPVPDVPQPPQPPSG
jgi:hypothetical protein